MRFTTIEEIIQRTNAHETMPVTYDEAISAILFIAELLQKSPEFKIPTDKLESVMDWIRKMPPK